MVLTPEVRRGIEIAILVCEDISKNAIGHIAAAQLLADSSQAQTDYGIGLGAHKVKKVLVEILDGITDVPKGDYRFLK